MYTIYPPYVTYPPVYMVRTPMYGTRTIRYPLCYPPSMLPSLICTPLYSTPLYMVPLYMGVSGIWVLDIHYYPILPICDIHIVDIGIMGLYISYYKNYNYIAHIWGVGTLHTHPLCYYQTCSVISTWVFSRYQSMSAWETLCPASYCSRQA